MQKELQHLIEGLALKKPPHSVASIYRQVEQIAQQKGWECPTYRTFLNVVRKLDPGLVTLAHEGSKAYSETFDLIFRSEAPDQTRYGRQTTACWISGCSTKEAPPPVPG